MASRYYQRHRAAIINFTQVGTVYKRSLKTVPFKVSPLIAAEDGFSLLSVNNGRDACEIIRAIFAQLDEDQKHSVQLILNTSGEVPGFKVLGGRRDG